MRPETPLAALARLRQRDSVAVRAGFFLSPALADPATPFARLRALIELEPALADTVLQRPDVRDDPARLIVIVDSSRARERESVQQAVRRRFRELLPRLAADSSASEYVLAKTLLAISWWFPGDTAQARQLLSHPTVRRSPTLLAQLAATLHGEPDSIVALLLVYNPTAQRDRIVLRTLAGLDSVRFAPAPQRADSLLRVLGT